MTHDSVRELVPHEIPFMRESSYSVMEYGVFFCFVLFCFVDTF